MMRNIVSYCICADRAVFLDFKDDRYFCLPSHLNNAFMRLFKEGDDISDVEYKKLERAGVVNTSTVRLTRVTPLPPATEELTPSQTPSSLLVSALSQMTMGWRLKYGRFARVIEAEQSRRPHDRVVRVKSDLPDLYASFVMASTWLGESDQCLARSLAFRMLALRMGYASSLVIGVKLDPFAAHCWVQTDVRVDNDMVERVRLFTPIFVL